jgi:phosphopantothenoylcysteine decarboxylase/phosphopantothenate--cysteine ligase
VIFPVPPAARKTKMHFLITAGGTREHIDPVRFISNASSGRRGYALAAAAKSAGHEVTLISASDIQPPVGVEFIGVESAADMFASVRENFPKCDCLIMAAAVADYTPVKKSKVKIKKSNTPLTIKLKPTTDILAWAKKRKGAKQYVAGFALEDRNIRANAQKKLEHKKLDMIIANTPEALGCDEITIQLKATGQKWKKLPHSTKRIAARRIISVIEKEFGRTVSTQIAKPRR